MLPKTMKRIMSDLKEIEDSKLGLDRIFVMYDDSNIGTVYAMIYGPEDTPYEFGYYFFKVVFPDNYPFSPPKVTYYTQGEDVRFNPNLYTCGKVCLSIINTWEGPGWTASSSLKSVLLSLVAHVFNSKPLTNEPGYENETTFGKAIKEYNDILLYANYKIAILNMINKTPKEFNGFREIMDILLVKNYDKISDALTKHEKTYKNKTVAMTASMYCSKQYKCDYAKLRADIDAKYNSLKTADLNMEMYDSFFDGGVAAAATHVEETPIVKKSTIKVKGRKAPTDSAKIYDLGHQLKSDNDGQMYEIKEKSNGVKYWAKI